MKKCIPALLFLFFMFSFSVFTASGQSPASIKTVNIDSADEDIICVFPFSEIESEFPGGTEAWQSFIRKNLKYPRAAWKAKIQGTVVVTYAVNPDGKVSDIEAVSGPEELRQAAMDVIKKSPNWKPAVQRGHNVKSFKKQPIVFRIEK